MTVVQQLLERNRLNPPTGGLAIEPRLRTVILACSDQRADPAVALGLEPGDAVVIRNAGGRVTPAVLCDLAILATVAQIEGITGEFELIVMQHTDCGTSRLSGGEYTRLLASHFGVDHHNVADRAVNDPRAAVAFDVQQLRDNTFLPDTLITSGIVYDIETGTAELVTPPRRSPRASLPD